jgi:hypothetical protein
VGFHQTAFEFVECLAVCVDFGCEFLVVFFGGKGVGFMFLNFG